MRSKVRMYYMNFFGQYTIITGTLAVLLTEGIVSAQIREPHFSYIYKHTG